MRKHLRPRRASESEVCRPERRGRALRANRACSTRALAPPLAGTCAISGYRRAPPRARPDGATPLALLGPAPGCRTLRAPALPPHRAGWGRRASDPACFRAKRRAKSDGASATSTPTFNARGKSSSNRERGVRCGAQQVSHRVRACGEALRGPRVGRQCFGQAYELPDDLDQAGGVLLRPLVAGVHRLPRQVAEGLDYPALACVEPIAAQRKGVGPAHQSLQGLDSRHPGRRGRPRRAPTPPP